MAVTNTEGGARTVVGHLRQGARRLAELGAEWRARPFRSFAVVVAALTVALVAQVAIGALMWSLHPYAGMIRRGQGRPALLFSENPGLPPMFGVLVDAKYTFDPEVFGFIALSYRLDTYPAGPSATGGGAGGLLSPRQALRLVPVWDERTALRWVVGQLGPHLHVFVTEMDPNANQVRIVSKLEPLGGLSDVLVDEAQLATVMGQARFWDAEGVPVSLARDWPEAEVLGHGESTAYLKVPREGVEWEVTVKGHMAASRGVPSNAKATPRHDSPLSGEQRLFYQLMRRVASPGMPDGEILVFGQGVVDGGAL